MHDGHVSTTEPAGTSKRGSAMKQMIRLRGISGEIKGKVWEAETLLRAGRLNSLEIVLDDSSVSRKHAELRHSAQGWMVHDLDSTNGTFVNGVRLGKEDRPVRSRDIVQFGKVAMIVELNDSAPGIAPPEEQMMVEATSHQSWEEAFQGLAFDRNRCPRPGEQLLALLRAGHHIRPLPFQPTPRAALLPGRRVGPVRQRG
jgi:predicted component of type VI protein secretion system